MYEAKPDIPSRISSDDFICSRTFSTVEKIEFTFAAIRLAYANGQLMMHWNECDDDNGAFENGDDLLIINSFNLETDDSQFLNHAFFEFSDRCDVSSYSA